MDRPHTAYGRRKLDEASYAAQQAKKNVTSPGGVIYGRRKGGGESAAAVTPSLFEELRAGLHAKPIGWAAERIARLENALELQALHALEQDNPKAPRKGILNLLEERLGELGIENPSTAAPKPSPATPEKAEGQGAGEGESTGEGGENPFAGELLLDVDFMEQVLTTWPDLLDDAIDAEFRHGTPREDAAALLSRIENARKGGPRPEVIRLLEQF